MILMAAFMVWAVTVILPLLAIVALVRRWVIGRW